MFTLLTATHTPSLNSKGSWNRSSKILSRKTGFRENFYASHRLEIIVNIWPLEKEAQTLKKRKLLFLLQGCIQVRQWLPTLSNTLLNFYLATTPLRRHSGTNLSSRLSRCSTSMEWSLEIIGATYLGLIWIGNGLNHQRKPIQQFISQKCWLRKQNKKEKWV